MKYMPDPNHVVDYEPLSLKENLIYEDKPLRNMDRENKEIRNKSITCVRVLWSNHEIEDATWELEENMRNKYPYLFERRGMLSFKAKIFYKVERIKHSHLIFFLFKELKP